MHPALFTMLDSAAAMLDIHRLAGPGSATFVVLVAVLLACAGNLLAKLGGRRKPATELSGLRKHIASIAFADPAQAAREPSQGQRLSIKLHRDNNATSGKVQYVGGQHRYSTYIDVYGKDLPAVAAMVLPLQGSTTMASFHMGSLANGGVEMSWELAPATVHGQLDNLIAAGDNPLVLELLSRDRQKLNDTALLNVPLKPSHLKQTLLPAPSASKGNEGPAAEPFALGDLTPEAQEQLDVAYGHRRREGALWSQCARWLLCPAVGIAFCWLLAVQTSTVLEWLPACPGLQWVETSPDLAGVMPAFPTTMLEAFDLGQITWQLEHNDSSDLPALLAAAEAVLGKRWGEDQLLSLRAALAEVAGRRTVWQRVTSLFTFINIMWVAAIIGIAVSVGPVAWLVSEPIRKWLTGTLRRIVVWVATEILLPVVTRLHVWGVLESALYLVAAIVMAHGSRVPAGPGLYITLTGVALAPALFYCERPAKPPYTMRCFSKPIRSDPIQPSFAGLLDSCHLHGVPILSKYGDSLKRLGPGLFALVLIPLAVGHQSSLLGYGAVSCVLTLLGLTGGAGRLCIFIGFEGEDVAVRTSISCAAGLMVFVGIRAAGLHPACLAPFVSGVSVLGGIGHYLSLLILCLSESGNSRDSLYLRRDSRVLNGLMGLSLLLSTFCGRMYDMAGMANTATVFAVLWLLQWYAAFHFRNRYNGWLFIFLSSVCAYYAALWLHANPVFVVSLAQMAY